MEYITIDSALTIGGYMNGNEPYKSCLYTSFSQTNILRAYVFYAWDGGYTKMILIYFTITNNEIYVKGDPVVSFITSGENLLDSSCEIINSAYLSGYREFTFPDIYGAYMLTLTYALPEPSAPSAAPTDAPTSLPSFYTSSLTLIKTYVGDGTQSYTDGVSPLSTGLVNPVGVWGDSAGNFYMSENFGQRVNKVSVSDNIIRTIAGNGASL